MPYNLPALKARLTRAAKTGDPRKVREEARRALALFDAQGYPDCWHLWERAYNDANLACRFLHDS